MKRRNVMIIIAASAILPVWGTVVDVRPGHIASVIEEGIGSDGELVLKGGADARDFGSLALLASDSRLKVLDLSGLHLQGGYLSTAGSDGRYHYEEGELPAYLFAKSRVATLMLPANLREVPEGLLSGASVSTLTIPASAEGIGEYAFHNARLLTTLKGGEGVRRIGRRAFHGCGLRRLDVSGATSYASYSLAGMPDVWQIKMNPQAEYGDGVVAECPLLTNLTGYPRDIPPFMAAFSTGVIPGNIVRETAEVGEFAFAGVPAIWLLLTGSTTALRAGAFANATTLVNVDVKQLGDRVIPVEPSTFAGIDLSAVELYVDPSAEDVWRAAPVWGEFDIKTGENSVGSVKGDDAFRIIPGDGMVEIVTPGWEGMVGIYDMSGIRLYSGRCDGCLVIDTTRLQGEMLVVRIGEGLKTAVIVR